MKAWFLGAGLAALIAFPVQASVIGSSITCNVLNGSGLGGGEPNCDPAAQIITAGGPTIVINGNGTVPALNIAFMAGWIDISAAPGLGSIGFTDEIIQISGIIDSTGETPTVRGFSDTVADPDFGLSDVTFSGNTLSIDLSGVTWLAGESAGFDVAVPLPLPALLLLSGLAGLGFVARRKKGAEAA